MTKIKFEGTLAAPAELAMEDLRGRLYSKPGMRIMVVAELAHTERTEPAPDEEKKESSVKLGIKMLEVARGDEQDELLRNAMQALKLQRTAFGTFDEELQALGLSPSTLEDVGNNLIFAELGRLRSALDFIGERMRRLHTGTFTEKQIRDETRKLHKVIKDALEWRDEDEPS